LNLGAARFSGKFISAFLKAGGEFYFTRTNLNVVGYFYFKTIRETQPRLYFAEFAKIFFSFFVQPQKERRCEAR
jgi:hypothetical protein